MKLQKGKLRKLSKFLRKLYDIEENTGKHLFEMNDWICEDDNGHDQ